MKLIAGSVATAIAVVVAAAAYTAWKNLEDEKQKHKVQPLLGVVYKR